MQSDRIFEHFSSEEFKLTKKKFRDSSLKIPREGAYFPDNTLCSDCYHHFD